MWSKLHHPIEVRRPAVRSGAGRQAAQQIGRGRDIEDAVADCNAAPRLAERRPINAERQVLNRKISVRRIGALDPTLELRIVGFVDVGHEDSPLVITAEAGTHTSSSPGRNCGTSHHSMTEPQRLQWAINDWSGKRSWSATNSTCASACRGTLPDRRSLRLRRCRFKRHFAGDGLRQLVEHPIQHRNLALTERIGEVFL